MVSKRFLFLLSCTFILSHCGPAGPDFSTREDPLILSVQPTTASLGTALRIQGQGFSIVAPENIIMIGGTSTVANQFSIQNDGTEILGATIPLSANPGTNTVMVVVDGQPSNSVNVSLTP